jgi:hypothetical protein
MPLNKKGKKIKKAMVKQYGKKKGESVFYAMENSGKLKKVTKARYGGGADMGAPGRQQERAQRGYGGTGKGTGGRDPSAATKGKVSDAARQALTAQRETARGRISPSTTPKGKAVAAGIGVIGSMFGIPGGYQIGKRMVDRSPMAFGVPKSTKKNVIIDTDRDRGPDGPQQTTIVKTPIIPGPVQINEPILPLEQTRLGTVSPTGRFGYTVGFRKGGMLRQGKPKLAKKGWK